METNIPKVQVTEKMENAQRILLQSHFYALPILNQEKYVGMLDRTCKDRTTGHLEKLVRTDIKKVSGDGNLEELWDVYYPMIPIVNKDQVFLGVIRPKKVIKELLLKQQLYSSVIENSNDGILVIDHNGIIELVNEALVKLSGVPRKEYLGSNIEEIIARGIFKKESVTLRALKEEKHISDFQQYQNNIDVLVKAIPMFDGNNQLIKVLANVHDITDLVKSKRQLEKTQTISMRIQKKLYKLMGESNQAGTVIVSPQMKEIMNLTEQIAETNSTVFIRGESGTGKEVIANEIQQKSKRKNHSFIKVNCGAIPEELLESEFFGYESGAFTGAKKEGKPGLIELADKGTLFLDEIGELPLRLQVKLLRFFQEQVLTRIGGSKEIKVDVRIIVATNRNIEKMVSEGNFREDLYYRLNVVPIYLPPLRERKEEIIPLVIHFLNTFNQKHGKKKYTTTLAMDALQNYSWKGNIREIANLMERLVLTVKSDEIHLDNLPTEIMEENSKTKNRQNNTPLFIEKTSSSSENMFEEMEKKLIWDYLKENGSIRKAAKALGVSHTTLMRKMKKYDIRNNS